MSSLFWLSAALCLTAHPAFSLEIAKNSSIQVAPGQQPGSLVLGLAPSETPGETAGRLQVLVDCHKEILVISSRNGEELKVTQRELYRRRGVRRVALEFRQDQLNRGVVLGEKGPRVQLDTQGALSAGATVNAENFVLRIAVDSEGLYKLGYEDLQQVEPAIIVDNFGDPRQLRLLFNGNEIPIRFNGESDGRWDPGDGLEFYADQPLPDAQIFGPDTRRNPWSSSWSYFLATGSNTGLRMGQESAEIVETNPGNYRSLQSFYTTVHYEEDPFHSQLGFVLNEPQPDHFFWDISIRAGQLRTFDFVSPGLDNRSTDSVELTLCMRGGSAPSEGAPYKQRVQAFVNGAGSQTLDVGAEGDWENQELVIRQFSGETFPTHGDFFEENTLTIIGLDLPPAGEFSNAMLNWFDLKYKKKYRANNNELLFQVDPEHVGELVDITVTGFDTEDLQVYKIGQSKMHGALIRPDTGGFRLRIQDEPGPGDRYLVLAESQKKTPLSLTPWEYHDIRSEGPEKLLVIVADSLLREGGRERLEQLDPLWQRDSGGARIVSDYWIYDQYGDGRFSPLAIRNYLRTIGTEWITPPEEVLLVGDGALNQKEVRQNSLPVLPIYFEQVYRWGASANDGWYISSDSGVESAAYLSRWPINSPEQLQNMMDKRLAYDSSPAGEWNNSVYFIAASRRSEGDIFIEQRENLVQQNVPDDYFVRRLDVGLQDSRYDGLTAELIRQFDRGTVLCNYFGHGGGAVWFDFNLLRSDDVIRMANSQTLPLVTNTTCHIASIELEDALGKAFLNSGPMGAIGVLGASGLSFFYASMELVRLYYDYQLNNPDLPVVRALRLAEDQFRVDRLLSSSDSLNLEIANTVIRLTQYLGDPTQRLRLSRSAGEFNFPNPAVVAGEPLALSGTSSLGDAEGRLEFYSALSHPVINGNDIVDGIEFEDFQTAADGSWQLQTQAPQNLYPLGLWSTARVQIKRGQDSEHLSRIFFYADSLQQGWMSDAGLDPEFPQGGDTITLWLTAAAPEPIDSLFARISVFLQDGDSLVLERGFQALPDNPVRWTSETPIGPFENGSNLRIIYSLITASGEQHSNPTWFPVEQRRPLVDGEFLGYGEATGGQVAFRLHNRGNGLLQSLEIRTSNLTGDSLESWIAGPIAAGALLDTSFHLQAGFLGQTLDIEVDPLHLQSDSSTAGRWTLTLSEVYLSASADSQVGIRPLLPGISLSVAGAGIGGSAFKVRDLSEQASFLQPNLALNTPLFAVDPLVTQDDLTLALRVDSSLVRQWTTAGAILVRDELLDLALLGNGDSGANPEGAEVVYSIHNGRGIAVGMIDDSQVPHAELSVENQVFKSGDHVPERPSFSWILKDVNGLDSRSFSILLDGAPVDSLEYSLSAVGQGSNLLLRFTPEMDPGSLSHTLELQFRDAAGNAVEETLEFVVSGDFKLQYLGNYPNPFKTETRFIYNLSGVADWVEVAIYTVSGRRIRTLRRNGPIINYDEIFWDGRDESGAAIANGVYFYKFKAGGQNGELSRRGKMAKLK